MKTPFHPSIGYKCSWAFWKKNNKKNKSSEIVPTFNPSSEKLTRGPQFYRFFFFTSRTLRHHIGSKCDENIFYNP